MRAHILKQLSVWMVVLGIFAGFGKTTAVSIDGRSFADWLAHQVAADGADELTDRLNALSTTEAELHELISEATSLVTQYNTAFNLPLSDTDETEAGAVYHLLISEWENANASNEMGERPPREIIRTLWMPVQKLLSTIGFDLVQASQQHNRLLHATQYLPVDLLIRLSTPFLSGIAIGAP